MITPENYMKYVFTEPTQGVFNYTGGDLIVNWAHSHGAAVRAHNFVWYSQRKFVKSGHTSGTSLTFITLVPDWLNTGTFTNATLISIMNNHITHVCGICSGTVSHC